MRKRVYKQTFCLIIVPNARGGTQKTIKWLEETLVVCAGVDEPTLQTKPNGLHQKTTQLPEKHPEKQPSRIIPAVAQI